MGRIIAYLKEHVRLAVFCLVGIALCGGLAALLQPGQPNLPAYEHPQAQAGEYYPGGSGCKPAEIDRLPVGNRQSKRDACGDKAEEHRLTQNDLLQQTRAADAAQAMPALGYQQSQVMLYGLIFGIVTLLAAVCAATFARDAAFHSKRAADTAAEALDDARSDANEQAERFAAQLGVASAAANAAKQGAEATALMAQTMSEQTALTRAQLSAVVAINLTDFDDSGPESRPEYVISIKHVSGGPAFEVRQTSGYMLTDDEARVQPHPDPQMIANIEGYPGSNAPLLPGDERFSEKKAVPWGPDERRLYEEGRPFYIYASVVYRDLFRDVHYAQCRYRVSHGTMPVICSTGNHTG